MNRNVGMKRLTAAVCACLLLVLAVAAGAETARDAEMQPQNAAVECLWTLSIDQTVETELNGYTLTGTLTVLAVKLGGTDALGVYSGTAHIQYTMHMAQGSVSGAASGEGQDLGASIEVVPYQSDAYDAAGGQAGLTELIAFDAMALGEFLLTGVGNAAETAGAASWSTQQSKAVPAPYRMTVDGGQVRLELYTVIPGAVFTGMITGEPIE